MIRRTLTRRLHSIRRQAANRRQGTRTGEVSWTKDPALVAEARRNPPVAPMVLVISLPRSGSTWVGSTLGVGSDSIYLHEPFTQSYLAGRPNDTAMFELGAEAPNEFYRRASAQVRDAIPEFAASAQARIVREPGDWDLADRAQRRLVVKEVNPFALDYFVEELQPRVIHLVRHPAAVAFSTAQLPQQHPLPASVQPASLEELLPAWPSLDGDPWATAGARCALGIKLARRGLAGRDHLEVRYEDLCLDPLAVFHDMTDFSGLVFSPALSEHIERSTSTDGNRANLWGLERDSVSMVDSFRTDLSPREFAAVRTGYRMVELGAEDPYPDTDW